MRIYKPLLKSLTLLIILSSCQTTTSVPYMPEKLKLEPLPPKPEEEVPLYYQIMERNYLILGQYVLINERSNRSK